MSTTYGLTNAQEENSIGWRCRKDFGFHVCDWKCDTNNLLLDRGLMGEGVIDIPGIGRKLKLLVSRA